jgi:hypothetical protein
MNLTNGLIPGSINFAGIEIIDIPGFLELLLRFTLNIVVILVLVRWLYYSVTRRKDYLFTYFLISIVIFLLCYLLESVKLQIGFALGLFAIFGIIRYRTNAIPIKEMTYLFLVIGISVINALTDTKASLADLIFTNLVIILITYGLEKIWLMKNELSKVILYEKIDLIKPEKYGELLNDLRERTGLKQINRVEAEKIDFLRDTCTLKIYYETTGRDIYSSNNNGIIRENDDDDDD